MKWIVLLDVPRSGSKPPNVLGVYPDDAGGRTAARESMATEGRITRKVVADDLITACNRAVEAELASRGKMAPKASAPIADGRRPPASPSKELTVSQAAKHYSCSASVVRRAIALGRLPARQ